MTKKDYVLIAGAIKPVTLTARKEGYNNSTTALNDVIGRLADALQADNPRFERERFFTASGF